MWTMRPIKAKVIVCLVMLLGTAAAASGDYAEGWWWQKYQAVGQRDPKWDRLVAEGIGHWSEERTEQARRSFQKALDAGCRCPIVKYLCAQNVYTARVRGGGAVVRRLLDEVATETADNPELGVIRYWGLDVLAYQYLRDKDYQKAIRTFEEALAVKTDALAPDAHKDAEKGLKKARARVKNLAELKALAGIALPANPTKEQVRRYIREIGRNATANVGARRRDLGARMVARVGPENVDVLLQMFKGQVPASYRMDYYIGQSLAAHVREEHKDMVLRWLELQDDLISIVLANGWVQDAKPALVKRLAEQPQWLSVKWVAAVAQLEDPATYDDLIWYLVHGSNESWTYRAIRELPGIELKDPVTELWNQSKSWAGRRQSQRHGVAGMAIEHGIVEALGFALDQLAGSSLSRYAKQSLTSVVRRCTGMHGTIEEIRAWYEQNKDNLEFDEKARVFRVAK